MGRRKKTEEPLQEEPGEQLDIIDVTPENAKAIVKLAKKYEATKRQRMALGEQEATQKQELLELIKNANLQRLDDGQIKCTLDGLTITVTPRDELVKVKSTDDEE